MAPGVALSSPAIAGLPPARLTCRLKMFSPGSRTFDPWCCHSFALPRTGSARRLRRREGARACAHAEILRGVYPERSEGLSMTNGGSLG